MKKIINTLSNSLLLLSDMYNSKKRSQQWWQSYATIKANSGEHIFGIISRKTWLYNGQRDKPLRKLGND